MLHTANANIKSCFRRQERITLVDFYDHLHDIFRVGQQGNCISVERLQKEHDIQSTTIIIINKNSEVLITIHIHNGTIILQGIKEKKVMRKCCCKFVF